MTYLGMRGDDIATYSELDSEFRTGPNSPSMPTKVRNRERGVNPKRAPTRNRGIASAVGSGGAEVDRAVVEGGFEVRTASVWETVTPSSPTPGPTSMSSATVSRLKRLPTKIASANVVSASPPRMAL